MTDNRNTILAVILSGLVLIAWQYFYNMPQMEKQRAAQQAQSELVKPTPQAGSTATPTATPQTGAAPSIRIDQLGSNAFRQQLHVIAEVIALRRQRMREMRRLQATCRPASGGTPGTSAAPADSVHFRIHQRLIPLCRAHIARAVGLRH